MFLRSLTKHVKDQNWFAVFLDFFIVVAGILIAFQITNWNEDRQSRIADRALVERLAEEFTTLEGLLEQRLARAEQLMGGTAELIHLVRNPDEPTDRKKVNDLIIHAARYSAPVASPTSFADALQAGRINNLQNADLRKALNAYVISTDWWATVAGPPQPQIDPDSKFSQAVTWKVDGNLETAGDREVSSFDWNKLILAERDLVNIQRKQVLQAEAYRLELVEVENILNTLNADR